MEMETEGLILNTQQKNKGLIRRFMPYYRPYLGILALDLFCAALTTVCEIVLPLIIRYLTDIGTNDLASLTVSVILRLGLLYLGLRLIDGAANYFMASIGHIMGARLETDMRRDLFSHLQKLSFTYYDNTKVGQVMSRITHDLFEVTEFSHHCPEEFFIAFLKIVAAFSILCTMNVWLTLIIFAVLPVMLACAYYFNKKMRLAFKDSRVQIGELNSSVEDSLLGIRVVKSFTNEQVEEEKFQEGNERFLNIKRRMYHYMACFRTSTRMFEGLRYIIVVVAGALFMIRGAIAPSDLIAYLMYVSMLLTTITVIVNYVEQFQLGMTGIERFVEIMDMPDELALAAGNESPSDIHGTVDFRNVSFHYIDGKKDVLSHITLHVEAGDSVAIVGPSGSGKTTMCNLIPRFYEISSGEILIDGKDIREYTLQSLRSQIGIVQQDVYLFAGTVYENILYGRPDATEEEVLQAAKLAGAHAFIERLTDGYQTNVGERGVKLSGGQKQRISIARVFLKNPPVLILDEATSALDNESERIVQDSLERLTKGRTTFTVAHRLSTIQNAKTILVLTENGIEEMGSHAELMQKRGVYYRLYQNSGLLENC